MTDVPELNQLGLNLLKHGDRSEREFWPLLAGRFPSYELLWQRLIVPLTHRIDPHASGDQKKWIRLRADVPNAYEETAMAHYSVFYFLGRAVKRISEDKTALNHPEDVIFLLDSVGDNLKSFLLKMNKLGGDSGRKVFDMDCSQFPKGFFPFDKISNYRDILLHNAVIGRAVDVENTFLPKWAADKTKSPLERAKKSWYAAEQLKRDDWISTTELFNDLIEEVCQTLEKLWQRAIEVVSTKPFRNRMERVIRLADYSPISFVFPSATCETAASGTFILPKD
jgi:hypothetical protein